MKMHYAFILLVRSKVTTLIMYCIWIRMVLDMIFNLKSFFLLR